MTDGGGMRTSWLTNCILVAWLTVGARLVSGGDPVDAVDTRIGTDSGYALSHGSTYPATSLPWGMTGWSAQTGDFGSGWIYAWNDTTFTGVRATHLASPWLGDYGTFTVMPITGELVVDMKQRASPF